MKKPSQLFDTPQATGFDRVTHNTREGIEEMIEQKSLSARDCLPDEEVINASQAVEIFHQELQKAREEERERIKKDLDRRLEIQKKVSSSEYEGGYTHALQDVKEAYQSELDQPTVCKVCHGHGNNGADDTLCLNCGGTGKEETAEKTTAKYTLKDFCIEFRDEVNNNPEMLSALRQLMTNPS